MLIRTYFYLILRENILVFILFSRFIFDFSLFCVQARNGRQAIRSTLLLGLSNFFADFFVAVRQRLINEVKIRKMKGHLR